MNRTTRARALRAVAPVAGLLAAGLLVYQGSYAAFNATTSNTADSWATGTLALENNGGNGSTYAASTTGIFAQTGVKIGDSGTKCLTVSSTGSMPGSLRLFRGTISGTNNSALAPQIKVTVEAVPVSTDISADCTNYPTSGITTLHSAVGLNSLPTTYAGASGVSLSGGAEKVAYRFSWTLQTLGSPTLDNPLQGSTAQADLTFEVQ